MFEIGYKMCQYSTFMYSTRCTPRYIGHVELTFFINLLLLLCTKVFLGTAGKRKKMCIYTEQCLKVKLECVYMLMTQNFNGNTARDIENALK